MCTTNIQTTEYLHGFHYVNVVDYKEKPTIFLFDLILQEAQQIEEENGRSRAIQHNYTVHVLGFTFYPTMFSRLKYHQIQKQQQQ